MDSTTTRELAKWLGIGSIVFGVAPALAPRFSAALFGVPVDRPALDVIIRSVGVRDAVIGMGLWSSAAHGGNYAPWVLARALCDTGDSLGIGVALGQGERDARFLGLGAIALGAAVVGHWLHLEARRQKAA